MTSLKDAILNIQDSLFADLENGVQWMNEEASKKFATEYPRLLNAINQAVVEAELEDD